MSVHHTDDCGDDRCYNFRHIQANTIRFQVQAGNDVSVCLATDDQETQPEDMYEVFIGGWGGAESAIRRKKDEDVCKVETPDILSADEMRGFWIKISRGVIKVGRKGERQAFMSYTDPETLLHVTHYGFCTAYGSEGDWTFSDDKEDDASSSDSSGASSSDSEAEDLEALEEKPITYKRPARWVPAKGGYMPRNPVNAGEGSDGPIYVGMARHEGGTILGMVNPAEGVCYIPWGGEAIAKDEYFILANPTKVEMAWVPCSDGNAPPGAFQGGDSEDGEPLYIGRVSVDGVVSCGKVHPSHNCCYVPYAGAEHSHKHYEVLCVKSIPCRI